MPHRVNSITIRVMAVIVMVVGLSCGGGDSASESGEPPEQALERAASRMARLTSLRFTLAHEDGYTPLMAGVDAQQAEGVVALPDKASLEVDARIRALGSFISLRIVVDGTEATMTDPLTGTPRPLPASSLPFNFLDLGTTLGDIALAIRDPAFTDRRALSGVSSRGIAGTVTGPDLRTLIPPATDDAVVKLEVWVGDDFLIRRVRITGTVVADDPAGVERVLTFSSFDQPVNIQPLT